MNSLSFFIEELSGEFQAQRENIMERIEKGQETEKAVLDISNTAFSSKRTREDSNLQPTVP